MDAMTVVLSGIVGSTAYGLAREGSDIDRLGCYVEPTDKFLGLHPPTGKAASRVRTNPDVTEHEIGKYVSLLLNCNPTVTELLWLDEWEVKTDIGAELVAMRSAFPSARRVRNAYLGYATAQFRKLCERGDGSFSADTRKRTAKHARHLRRLCWQGLHFYTEGTLPIRVENPDQYHEFGERVAADPLLAQNMINGYAEMFDSATSALPDEPDEAAVNDWLVSVRRRFL